MRSVPLLLLGKNNNKANIATMVASIAANTTIHFLAIMTHSVIKRSIQNHCQALKK